MAANLNRPECGSHKGGVLIFDVVLWLGCIELIHTLYPISDPGNKTEETASGS